MKQDCSKGKEDMKWQLLRSAGGARPWRTLEDTRQCVLCEQTFQGHQVRVVWDLCGIARLRCPTPGCSGMPAQWIHPGNPLISEEAWHDWVGLLETLCEEPVHPQKPRSRGERKTRRGALAVHRR